MRGDTEAVQFNPEALDAAARALRLRLVVLHGSRAEGRAEVGSDIDIAVLADGAVEEGRRLEIYRGLGALIGGASLDISLLNGAQPNFMAVVADTGRALWECAPGEFLRFRSLAARMFCDAQKWQQAQWEHLGEVDSGQSTVDSGEETR
jgi:predicted nucleotidyltransferase